MAEGEGGVGKDSTREEPKELKDPIIFVVAAIAVILTLLLSRLCSGGSGKKRAKKRATGKGPTGKGKVKIYHSKILRSSRVTWLIEEMGIQDDFKIIEFSPFTATEEEMDWFKREVNPHGLVPAMVFPDGSIMTESSAMCLYIAEQYGQMLPDPGQEPNYYNWCISAIGAIGEYLNNVYHPILKKVPPHKIDRMSIINSQDKIKGWLEVLEKYLEGKTYICGEKMTAADCIVGYTTMYASVVENGSLLMADDYPNVASYLSRLKKRPAFVNNVGTISDWP